MTLQGAAISGFFFLIFLRPELLPSLSLKKKSGGTLAYTTPTSLFDRLSSSTQEIGFVDAVEGRLDYEKYPIGCMLFILPWHVSNRDVLRIYSIYTCSCTPVSCNC